MPSLQSDKSAPKIRCQPAASPSHDTILLKKEKDRMRKILSLIFLLFLLAACAPAPQAAAPAPAKKLQLIEFYSPM